MIKRVMINIQKSVNFNFDEQQRKEYSEALKQLGCTTFKNAHNCFKGESRTIGEVLKLNGNIEFPLSALSQLIDTDESTFSYGLSKMAEGNEYSWVSQWLNAQGVEYDKIDDYVEKSKIYNKEGLKYIYPQMKDRWEYAVGIRLTDLYNGKDLDAALEIMKALDEGKPISDVMYIFNNQDHSGASYGIVKSLVVEFSKRGPEFGRATERYIDPEREKYFDQKEQRNKMFESELSAKGKKSNQDELGN